MKAVNLATHFSRKVTELAAHNCTEMQIPGGEKLLLC